MSSSARVESTSHEYRPRYLFTVVHASSPVWFECSRNVPLDFSQFLLRVLLRQCWNTGRLERLSIGYLPIAGDNRGNFGGKHLSPGTSWPQEPRQFALFHGALAATETASTLHPSAGTFLNLRPPLAQSLMASREAPQPLEQ